MVRVLALLLVMLISGMASGCSMGTSHIYAVPQDFYDYQRLDYLCIYEQVTMTVCPGCTGGYFARFHYAPRQTDNYFGEKLTNSGEDFAILTKPLYHNDSEGMPYLSCILSVDCYDSQWRPIKLAKPIAVTGYDPETNMVLLDGFPYPGQTNFTISYLHNQPGTFGLWYITPPPEYDYTYPNDTKGYMSADKVGDWVEFVDTVTVEPFMVKHIPVSITPDPAECQPSERYKFKIGIGEMTPQTGLPIAAGVEQWWLINISGRN